MHIKEHLNLKKLTQATLKTLILGSYQILSLQRKLTKRSVGLVVRGKTTEREKGDH